MQSSRSTRSLLHLGMHARSTTGSRKLLARKSCTLSSFYDNLTLSHYKKYMAPWKSALPIYILKPATITCFSLQPISEIREEWQSWRNPP